MHTISPPQPPCLPASPGLPSSSETAVSVQCPSWTPVGLPGTRDAPGPAECWFSLHSCHITLPATPSRLSGARLRGWRPSRAGADPSPLRKRWLLGWCAHRGSGSVQCLPALQAWLLNLSSSLEPYRTPGVGSLAPLCYLQVLQVQTECQELLGAELSAQFKALLSSKLPLLSQHVKAGSSLE